MNRGSLTPQPFPLPPLFHQKSRILYLLCDFDEFWLNSWWLHEKAPYPSCTEAFTEAGCPLVWSRTASMRLYRFIWRDEISLKWTIKKRWSFSPSNLIDDGSKACWIFLLLRCKLTFLGIGLLNPWRSGEMINSAIIKMAHASITKQWIQIIVYTSPNTKI